MENVQIRITTKHNDKMENMQSLSTSSLTNPQCIKNAKVKGSICEKCFSNRLQKRCTNLKTKLDSNTYALTKIDLSENPALIPMINASYFRFEAFGDLHNALHAKNYFTIASANPDTHFALWTKNPAFIQMAIDKWGLEKPDNLQIVLSSMFINKPSDCKWFFVDKIFTVYSKECIESEGIDINCGSKKCFECRLCYRKNTTFYINEKIK